MVDVKPLTLFLHLAATKLGLIISDRILNLQMTFFYQKKKDDLVGGDIYQSFCLYSLRPLGKNPICPFPIGKKAKGKILLSAL
jgi:hypothetical protein